MTPTRLVALVGPTAVGKTALSIRLAQRFGAEILGADSRQIYRFMDIGTAKPTAGERALVKHHLIDIVAPDEVLSLYQYRQLALAAIDEVCARDHLPIMVGGSGLYTKAVVEGWTVPQVEGNPEMRASLEQQAQAEGAQSLWERLQRVDPRAAAKVDARNVRRVIRYLEVYAATGEPISSQQHKVPPAFPVLQLGLTMPREALYRRIDERVEAMFAAGFVDEVRALLARGYAPDLPALSGFGYHQIIRFLSGDWSLADAVRETKLETRRFVRRQYAWYRLDDPSIQWLHADEDSFGLASEVLERFLDA